MTYRYFLRVSFVSVLGLGFFLGLSSCSLFGTRSDAPVPERDVPLQARKSMSAEPRKRVLVLPFLDAASGSRGDQVADVARKTFIRQLGLSDQVVVVDVADFPKDLAQFKKEDWDLEAIGKIAGSMGISGIIEGKILELNAKKLGDQVGVFRKVLAQHEAKVRIRMTSAKSGREVLNEVRSAQVEASTTMVGSRAGRDSVLAEDPSLIRESVTKAFRGIVIPILTALRKISWEGKIAMVSTDKIYVNAGRISGLQMGDILKVREPSESVYDPESGELVGVAPGRVKGTLEVISYFGKDGSVAVVHSGSGFHESDPVELY